MKRQICTVKTIVCYNFEFYKQEIHKSIKSASWVHYNHILIIMKCTTDLCAEGSLG